MDHLITELGRPGASSGGLGRASPISLGTHDHRALPPPLGWDPGIQGHVSFIRLGTPESKHIFHQTGCFGGQDRASPSDWGF